MIHFIQDPKGNELVIVDDYSGIISVTRNCILDNSVNSMDFPITVAALRDYCTGTVNVQDAFPDFTTEQREFLLSGITPDIWKTTFGDGSGYSNWTGLEEKNA
jgi:hypothetical protein